MSIFSKPLDKISDYMAERVVGILDARLKDNRIAPFVASQTAPLGTAKRVFNPDVMIGDTLKDACLATAIRVIADAVAGLPYDIMSSSLDDGKRILEPDNDHAARVLFERPNENLDEGELFQHIVQNLIAGGNAYEGLEPINGTIGEIWPVPAKPLDIAVDRQGKLFGYQFKPDGFTVKAFYPVEEMIHIKLYHAADQWFGRARLEPVERQVKSNFHMDRENSAFFEGGARYDAVFLPTDEMDPTQIEQMKQAVAQKRSNDQIAHGWFVPPVPGDVKALQASMREMEFIEGLRMNREKILGMLGVPPSLAGVFEYANFANAKVQEASFWRHTMKPLLLVIERAITRQLIHRHFDEEHEFKFDLTGVEALQQDAIEKAKAFGELVRADILTRDEARQRGYDLEPHPDGRGEEPFTPAAAIGAPVAPGSAPPDPNKDPDDDKGQDKAIAVKALKRFDLKAAAIERSVYGVIRRFFQQQHRRIQEDLNAVTNDGKTLSLLWLDLIGKNDDDAIYNNVFDRDREDQLLLDAMGPLYESGVRKSGDAALTDFDISIDIAFDITQPEVRAFIVDMENKIKTINKSAWKSIQRILKQSMDDGVGVEELARRIRDQYRHLASSQARTIARTESIKILNGSSHHAWKQTGVITHRQWIATLDSRTRDPHMFMYKSGGYNREVRRMDEPFIGGGDALMYPGDGPAHQAINCRCTTIPVVDDDPSANLNPE